MSTSHTTAEIELIKNAKDGKATLISRDLRNSSPDDQNKVDADLLRQVLLDLDTTPTPQGITLRGIHLVKELDLRDCALPVGLHLIGCRVHATMIFEDASIPRIVLSRSKIVGIKADGVRIEKGLYAEMLRCHGSIRMIGASITGQLNMTGAQLNGSGECALLADGLQVSGDLLLNGHTDKDGDVNSSTFSAEGGADGAIRLLGADIGGNLDCQRSIMRSSDGPALNAERARIGGNLLLREFEGHGGTSQNSDADTSTGVVILHGVSLRGQLNCMDATLHGRGVPALTADGIRVDGDVFLSRLNATGSGSHAVVYLIGARIGGHLVCRGEHGRTICNTDPEGLTLDVRFTEVGKAFDFQSNFIDTEHSEKVSLEGLTYPAVPEGMTCSEWRRFLRKRTRNYAAQPYQQLASVYHSAGQEEDARTLLIARHDDLLCSGNLPWRAGLRLRLLKLTLGYGYQSWRALTGLLITLILAMVLTTTAGRTTYAVHTVPVTKNLKRCALIDQIGLGVDLAIPLVNTTSRQRCNLIASNQSEEWLVGLGWIFQISGWAFATLFVAGYTGLIRRS